VSHGARQLIEPVGGGALGASRSRWRWRLRRPTRSIASATTLESRAVVAAAASTETSPAQIGNSALASGSVGADEDAEVSVRFRPSTAANIDEALRLSGHFLFGDDFEGGSGQEVVHARPPRGITPIVDGDLDNHPAHHPGNREGEPCQRDE